MRKISNIFQMYLLLVLLFHMIPNARTISSLVCMYFVTLTACLLFNAVCIAHAASLWVIMRLNSVSDKRVLVSHYKQYQSRTIKNRNAYNCALHRRKHLYGRRSCVTSKCQAQNIKLRASSCAPALFVARVHLLLISDRGANSSWWTSWSVGVYPRKHHYDMMIGPKGPPGGPTIWSS